MAGSWWKDTNDEVLIAGSWWKGYERGSAYGGLQMGRSAVGIQMTRPRRMVSNWALKYDGKRSS